MKQPILVCNVGWMEKYQGLACGDAITGGGSYVAKHGYGHEIYNFAHWKGRVYGFVQVRGQLNVARLGAGPGADKVMGVVVAWSALRPGVGPVVVGWYKDATVHAASQPALPGAGRGFPGTTAVADYCVVADEADAVLLEPDQRTLRVPRGKGCMGQSPVWYADSGSPAAKQFRNALDVLLAGTAPKTTSNASTAKGAGWQSDVKKRLACERAAIEAAGAWYEAQGYKVRSVEKEHVGWDLEALLPEMPASLLRVEVKGASGEIEAADLTPNEYVAVKTHRDSYRLCLVSHALDPRRSYVHRFWYSAERNYWADQDDRVLKFDEVVAARVRVAPGTGGPPGRTGR